jgi:hypothetical protein
LQNGSLGNRPPEKTNKINGIFTENGSSMAVGTPCGFRGFLYDRTNTVRTMKLSDLSKITNATANLGQPEQSLAKLGESIAEAVRNNPDRFASTMRSLSDLGFQSKLPKPTTIPKLHRYLADYTSKAEELRKFADAQRKELERLKVAQQVAITTQIHLPPQPSADEMIDSIALAHRERAQKEQEEVERQIKQVEATQRIADLSEQNQKLQSSMIKLLEQLASDSTDNTRVQKLIIYLTSLGIILPIIVAIFSPR